MAEKAVDPEDAVVHPGYQESFHTCRVSRRMASVRLHARAMRHGPCYNRRGCGSRPVRYLRIVAQA